MDTEVVEVDPDQGHGTKKGKDEDSSVLELSDPVCNGDRVNRNGLNSVSPENSRDSCDSSSDINKTEMDTAESEGGTKTNGVSITEITSDGDVISCSTDHNDDMNCLDNREPIVLCDEETFGSTDLDKSPSGANHKNPAKVPDKNTEKCSETVSDANMETSDGSRCDSRDSDSKMSARTNQQDSKNDTDSELSTSKKSSDLSKENEENTKDLGRKEAEIVSTRRSSHQSEPRSRDENKENMEVTKTPNETPTDSPTPDDSKNQENIQKGSRIARLMENREGGELENMRPMAGLLFGVGLDLARQQIFKDLIRVQHKKQSQNKLNQQEEEQLNKLKDAFDVVVTKNDAYVQDSISCTECNFKTEARNVMEWHKEFAHDQDTGMYSCSFCDYQDRSPGNFFFHMEAEHNRRGRIYMRSPFYSCPLCPFENNSKASMNKHKMKCERHFKLKRNLEPTPTDCDIPLKKVKKPQPKQQSVKKPLPVSVQAPPRTITPAVSSVHSQRPLPPMPPLHRPPTLHRAPIMQRPQVTQNMVGMPMVSIPSGSAVRQSIPPPVLQPQPGVQQYSLGGGMYTLINNNGQIIMQPAGMPAIPLGQSSMINANALAQSLAVPLNRLQAQQTPQSQLLMNANKPRGPRPGTVASEIAKKSPAPVPIRPQNPQAPPQFEICEICGGFVKDRESLRIHFYWAHKVDIHKDIFNRAKAHLSCEVCPQRFWTYQGLARHRMSKHGKGDTRKRYHCQVCGKRDVENLLQHLEASHGLGLTALFAQKKCLCCGMMFASRSSLERHLMHTHSDLFKNTPYLQSDKNKSPGKAGYPIVITSPNSGNRIAPVPTGLYENAIGKKKVYEPFCSICNISFPTIDSFKLHCERLHSFKCYRCGENYSSEDMRFKHFQDTHKNEKEPCQICGEKAMIGRPLIRHMKRCHIKECSVVIQRLSEKKFKFYMKKRQEKLAREMEEAVRKRSILPKPILTPVGKAVNKTITLTPVGKPFATGIGKPVATALAKPATIKPAAIKPAANRSSADEVIIIDEDDDKVSPVSKKLPKGNDSSKVTASLPPDDKKPSEKSLPNPTPGLKEQVMEVDGEQFIIQMQDDDDGNDEAENLSEDGDRKKPGCDNSQLKNRNENDQKDAEKGQGQPETLVTEDQKETKKGQNGESRRHEDNDKVREKDPTADAVEILQNMADEIATSTKPMEID